MPNLLQGFVHERSGKDVSGGCRRLPSSGCGMTSNPRSNASDAIPCWSKHNAAAGEMAALLHSTEEEQSEPLLVERADMTAE
jgi:hypothetical protein